MYIYLLKVEENMYKLLEEVQNPSMKYNQNQKIIAFTNIHHH